MPNWYVALFDAGGEIAAADYTRRLAVFDITQGRTGNTERVIWQPTSNWGTIISLRLFAAVTGGSPVYTAALTQSIAMVAGTPYRIKRCGIVFPEGIYDTSLYDETLLDQAELGTTLPPVELSEFSFPPPTTTLRVAGSWLKRLA